MFEISEVYLSDERLDDFGDKDYILYRIEQELDVQFNTRKQFLLKTIYSYLDKQGSLYDTDCISMFGTNSFNLVWEKMCSIIMDNKLDATLGTLELPIPLNEKYNKGQRLIDLIEKPLWTITGKKSNSTLISDLVTIYKADESYHFMFLMQNIIMRI